jgi:hypothetical protein
MKKMNKRIENHDAFWALLAKGSTLIAACEAVGVDRRTGRRWRRATGGLVPRKRPEPSGRYLGLEERLRIADLRLAGTGVNEIARQIGRSPLDRQPRAQRQWFRTRRTHQEVRSV